MATLFSLILFFTPVILMSGLHSFVGWHRGRLRLGALTLQNMLEGVRFIASAGSTPGLGITIDSAARLSGS